MRIVSSSMAVALAGILSAVVGGGLSYMGQQSVNRAQMGMSQQELAFQEDMSNTAITRRVQDYKNAGLNPVLAAGGPGASVASPVMPQMQNPMSGAAGLGQSISSALQAKAAVDNTNANTKLTEAQTPGNVYYAKDDGSPDFARGFANGGILGNLSAGQMAVQIQQGESLVDKIQADTALSKSQTGLNDVMQSIQGLNKGILTQTYNWAIQQAIADAKIDMAHVNAAEAESRVMQGPWGTWIKGLQTAIGIGSGIAGAALPIGRAMGAAKGAPDITNIFQRR